MALSTLISLASNLAMRVPWDKVFLSPRDKAKALEAFAATLPAKNPNPSAVIEKVPEVTSENPAAAPSPTATTEETITELKRRLAKELYRAELDLTNKLRIAGKPCDCLERKHNLGIEATAEELIPKEPENTVYQEIIDWFRLNESKVTRQAIISGQYDNDYPRMAAEFTGFRKRVLGSEKISALIAPKREISLEEAKVEAAKLAQEEVEKQWH